MCGEGTRSDLQARKPKLALAQLSHVLAMILTEAMAARLTLAEVDVT